MPVRAAVYDLGSSSFQLLVCDVHDDGELQPVARSRAALDLGASVGALGVVPPERAAAARRAARRLAARALALQPDVTTAVATAALRDAANGAAVAAELAEVIGVAVRLVDGPEEARLCFVGQLAAVWTPDEPAAGVDLGGGSMELAVGIGHRLLAADSVPVGATRLRGELGELDVLGAAARHAVAGRVRSAVHGWPGVLDRFGVDRARLVASGGTVRALARLATARAHPGGASRVSVNQVELPAGQVAELADMLGELGYAQRLALRGMPSRRARSIAYGAAALHALVDTLGVGRIVVSEWGLREGAILDAARQQHDMTASQQRGNVVSDVAAPG